MISLPLTTHKLQVVLSGAITTNQLQASVFFHDSQKGAKADNSEVKIFPQYSTTNNTTDVDICSAPIVDIVRQIDTIMVFNNDTVSATVTIKVDISGTDQILKRTTLTANQTLIYEHGTGWQVL